MSHQAFMQLTGAGFTEEQTEALLEVYGEERASYVTRDDLEPLASKTDLEQFATKADLDRFATREDLQQELERFITKVEWKRELQRFATKEELQAMELRLTLRFGGMLAVAVAIVAAISRL